MQAVLQMAYAFLKDQARENDRWLALSGHPEEATAEQELDTLLGFIYIEVAEEAPAEAEEEDAPAEPSNAAEIFQFVNYWNERMGGEG